MTADLKKAKLSFVLTSSLFLSLCLHGREGCYCSFAQSGKRFFFFLKFPYELADEVTAIENNLFLVKRLIQRTDMRNPDTAPRRYTSLAWAAVLGHEETFEFLLTAGHDDEELSRVRCVSVTSQFSLTYPFCRIQRTTLSSCCLQTKGLLHPMLIFQRVLHKTTRVPTSEWPDCITTVIPGCLIGPTFMERLPCILLHSKATKNLSEYVPLKFPSHSRS